jgi:hypothetical protein
MWECNNSKFKYELLVLELKAKKTKCRRCKRICCYTLTHKLGSLPKRNKLSAALMF